LARLNPEAVFNVYLKSVQTKHPERKQKSTMSKTMCEKGKKGEKESGDLRFKCKKCGAMVRKEKQVCKPKEL
jgi:tRNA(Ile2) C34 agmatinyltransferase TiaS